MLFLKSRHLKKTASNNWLESKTKPPGGFLSTGRLISFRLTRNERMYKKATSGKKNYYDSLIANSTIYNALTAEISNGNEAKQLAFDSDPELIKKYLKKKITMKPLEKRILATSLQAQYARFVKKENDTILDNIPKERILPIIPKQKPKTDTISDDTDHT